MPRIARQFPALLLVVGSVVATGVALPPDSAAQGVSETPSPPALGRELFVESCASCHGADASGTERGVSLLDVGAASVDFQLRTGRMPLADPEGPTVRKPPAFSEAQIALLVDYVSSLGTGPLIPDVGTADGDVSAGSALFIDNCAPCHGATAHGGTVGERAFAPSLHSSEPIVVAEAMLTGPGEMPRFPFSEDERDAVLAYVDYLQDEPAPGGLDIGGVGPVPEGFLAWGVGIVLLLLIVVFIARPGRDKGTL